MNSRVSSAAASRGPLGADSTGLLATVRSARTWPSPEVSISSARQVMGSSPYTSGAFETRLRRRPVATPFPVPGAPMVLAAKAAALGNMAPPGASRWPVSALSTSTSQLLSEPKRCVQVPKRPYTAARSVAARVQASSRIAAASMPQRAETRSGVNGRTASRTCSTPFTWPSRAQGAPGPLRTAPAPCRGGRTRRFPGG